MWPTPKRMRIVVLLAMTCHGWFRNQFTRWIAKTVCCEEREKKAKKLMEKEDFGCNFDGLNDQIISPLRLKLAADIYEVVTQTAE